MYADNVLMDRLAAFLPQSARWSVVVDDMGSGEELVHAGPAGNEPLIPGSLVKLLTAGAVLDRGGAGAETTILRDGTIRNGTLHGNLYLRGWGNALLTTKDLRKAARKLSQLGIRKVTGDVVADATFFDPRGLERKRKGAGYACAGALGLDLHTVAVTVTPGLPGKPPLVTVVPPNDEVRLAVAARTTKTAVDSLSVAQLGDRAYRVKGDIAAGSGPLNWRFSLAEPALYAAGALKTELRRAGILVEGEERSGASPGDAKVLTEIGAGAIGEIVREMDVNSLNVVADNLLLLLGAESYGAPGTREKGLRAVSAFLATLDLPKGEETIADGSGLHPGNLVSARCMARYLAAVQSRPWFGVFRDSLPRAGLDGTVREIGYRNERFRVKSGRLENVYALAGYGVDAKGREISFAYIVNTRGPLTPAVERSGGELLRLLGELN